MKRIDNVLENVQKEVELYGRSGADSIYIDNFQFSISNQDFDIPSLANEDECINDVAWFFTCARKNMVVPHPNPDRSFWIKFFGDDALPYGATWNLKKLVETLQDDSKQRRAILSNSGISSEPPCVLLYQFQHLEHMALDLTVYLRSSDVANVLPQDVLMSRIILEQVAELVKLDIGKMTFVLANAHVYYKDAVYQEEFAVEYGD